MKRALLPLALVTASSTMAQITLEGTAQAPLRNLISLMAGPKLMDQYYVGSEVNIYNLDLTLYRTLTIPAPPPGYTWPMPNYVSESLFDTDPTTLEYMMTAYSENPGEFYFGIYREDGSALFTKNPGMALSGGGVSDFDSWPPIFQTPSGAKLLLQAGFSAPTEVYSLPGEVPCISVCFPTAQENFGVHVNESSVPVGRLSVQNPALGSASVSVVLPTGVQEGELIVVDAAGRVVRVEKRVGNGVFTLDTSSFAAGVYLLHMQTRLGALPTVPMTVLH